MATKTTTTKIQTLAELIEKINDCHQKTLKSLRTSLEHARQTGNYLLEAKPLVTGMSWLDWVEKNCQFSKSEAQRHMRIADRYRELVNQGFDLETMTMTDALKVLSASEVKKATTQPRKDQRLTVASKAELDDRLKEVGQVEFAKDTNEQKFLDAKAELIAKQILALAKKSAQKDDNGHAIGAVQVAIALIQQLKKRLDVSLVVCVESTVSSPVPHNRVNGALARSA
jgi:hypothetical protein